MIVRRIVWVFAITGVLVLAGITAMLLSGQTHVRIPAIAALVTFSAIILSYLGGIEGGIALREEAGTDRTRSVALGLSAVPALAAWGVLWLPSPQWQLGAALALLVAVWGADLWLAHQGLLPTWFVDMRTAITAAACVTLAFALYLL
jgi:hypothetical protein